MSEYRDVPVSDVSPNPHNPRETFDEEKIGELADSIDNKGLLQPVLTRPNGDGFELVHGERRFRAVKSLGHDTIKADVRELDDREALEISITENLQREDVSALAEARSYQALIDEFELTQGEAAERLGKSQSHISNRLGLLDLPDRLQEDILRKIFSPWQAKELARVWGEYWLWDLAVDWDLGVREIRSIVDGLQGGNKRVRVTHYLTPDKLDGFWSYAPDDMDGQAAYVSDGDVVRTSPVKYLNSRGEKVERLHAADTGHGLLWAKQTFDLYHDVFEDSFDDGADPSPIQIHFPRQEILIGYHRLNLAKMEDYTGEMEVEFIWPAEFFEWERRVFEGVDE